jgi:hypothetical protein
MTWWNPSAPSARSFSTTDGSREALAPKVSVGDGEPSLMMCWRQNFVSKRGGIVRARDLGIALGIGEQHVVSDSVASGCGALVMGAESCCGTYVEPIDRRVRFTQRI